jgi:hypothetical protein
MFKALNIREGVRDADYIAFGYNRVRGDSLFYRAY